MRKYLYCPRCDMKVGHDLKDDCYVCNACGFPNIVLLDTPNPKCPDCDKVTHQHLRGWKKGCYTSYRCGHCNKAYKVMEDKEDINHLWDVRCAIDEVWKEWGKSVPKNQTMSEREFYYWIQIGDLLGHDIQGDNSLIEDVVKSSQLGFRINEKEDRVGF